MLSDSIMKEIFNSLNLSLVKTVMAAWRNLRDPYRKKILNPGKPGGRGGGGGSKKSRSKGASLGGTAGNMEILRENELLQALYLHEQVL